jgi:hypothetical protein
VAKESKAISPALMEKVRARVGTANNGCLLCETGHDPLWGPVLPAEFINIRGEVAWRHPHQRDQMFTTACANQRPAPEKHVQHLNSGRVSL